MTMTMKEKFIEACLFATHTAETHEEERELFGKVYDKFEEIWLNKASRWILDYGDLGYYFSYDRFIADFRYAMEGGEQ